MSLGGAIRPSLIPRDLAVFAPQQESECEISDSSECCGESRQCRNRVARRRIESALFYFGCCVLGIMVS